MAHRRTVIVRLDTRLVDELDALADMHGSSRSAVLSQILRQRFPVKPISRTTA